MSRDRSFGERLDAVLQDLGSVLPRRTVGHVVDGPPFDAILRSVERFASDLIVIGSRVKVDPGLRLVANLAEQVAHAAPCAVLTVDEDTTEPPRKLRRILLPVDFSPATPVALGWAAAFARRFDASIELLHVRHGSLPPQLWPRGAGNGVASNGCRASLRLEGIQACLSAWGAEVASTTITDGSPFERILERVGKSDLVVMSTDTQPRRDGMIGPGVLASIRRRASVPVLSIRGPGGEPLLLNPGLELTAMPPRASAGLAA